MELGIRAIWGDMEKEGMGAGMEENRGATEVGREVGREVSREVDKGEGMEVDI